MADKFGGATILLYGNKMTKKAMDNIENPRQVFTLITVGKAE
jgi:hypothetical protein